MDAHRLAPGAALAEAPLARAALAEAGATLSLVDREWDAYELRVRGIPQSWVSLKEPRMLEYPYMQWVARMLDTASPAGAPLRLLHLGAGALTLPRYVAATRPRSEQLVVELQRDLLEALIELLPLPAGADVVGVAVVGGDGAGGVGAGGTGGGGRRGVGGGGTGGVGGGGRRGVGRGGTGGVGGGGTGGGTTTGGAPRESGGTGGGTTAGGAPRESGGTEAAEGESVGAALDAHGRGGPSSARGGTGLRLLFGDARTAVEESGPEGLGPVDWAMVDLWDAATVHARVASLEFYSEVKRSLAPGGTMVVNVLDGAGFDYARAQAATLAALFDHVAVLLDEAPTDRTPLDNVLIVARDSPLLAGRIAPGSTSKGSKNPHGANGSKGDSDDDRAYLLQGDELRSWIADAEVMTDLTATDSPPIDDPRFDGTE
jgi:spermidine synthase